MTAPFYYCHILFFLLLLPFVYSKSKYEKLLVVSYDGFRYDYLERGLTPVLNSLKNSSSYANYLLNVFPTSTFPNHFSIATGLYSEVHGVLGSKVFDKEKQEVLDDRYPLWHYNNDITPIWTLNEKAAKDRHSGVMHWPGCGFEYNGVNCTFTVPFNETVPWSYRVDGVIDWFNHPTTPANLVMLYFEEPDGHSHMFGPESAEVEEQIQRTDNITAYLLDQLAAHGLTDVNVVFLSDHGMETVTKRRIIDLTEYLGPDDVDIYGSSPVLQLYPKEGVSETEVYLKLHSVSTKNKNFAIYLKEEIPEQFYYKHCNRTPPLLAVAEPSYAFQDLYETIKKYVSCCNASEDGDFGLHGYDPARITMHPYFIAHGPQFKKNFKAPSLRTIDMFSMFAHVLQLDLPQIKPNGSFTDVQTIMATGLGRSPNSGSLLYTFLLSFMSILYTYLPHSSNI